MPRSTVSQGVLAGGALALGYGLGILARSLWRYLQLPEPQGRLHRRLTQVCALLCLLAAGAFLSQVAGWQNGVRTLMQMPPVPSAHPLEVSLIRLATFLALLMLGRLYRLVAAAVSRRGRRFLPHRVANVLGVAVALVLFWALVSDVLVRYAFRALDASFAQYDALVEPQSAQPTSPLKSGSPASLLDWEGLGRTGREFIASGPRRPRSRRSAGSRHRNRSASTSACAPPTPRPNGRAWRCAS